jgi:hypothetical protein
MYAIINEEVSGSVNTKADDYLNFNLGISASNSAMAF